MFDEELPPVANPDQEEVQPDGEVDDGDAGEEEDEEIDEQAEAGILLYCHVT